LKVALIGTILHTASDWNVRLPLAIGAIAVACVVAGYLVYRFVGVRKPALPGAVGSI
jgi:DHA2 family methylenomycin A resistance protein-like MFS transporter